jgi:6-phosphogluconate dehydrogenase
MKSKNLHRIWILNAIFAKYIKLITLERLKNHNYYDLRYKKPTPTKNHFCIEETQYILKLIGKYAQTFTLLRKYTSQKNCIHIKKVIEKEVYIKFKNGENQ